MAGRIRILSIDGGGIRGIIPAMVIKALLGDIKAQDAFHLIAGTSTGGIIACGLAKPNSVGIQKIIDLYVDHGHEIFRKPNNCLHWWYGPRYRPTALERYLSSELGGTYLSEVNDVELLIPSYAIGLPKENPPDNSCAPMFFRSWQARGLQLGDGAANDEYDFELASIARATSAAPTYFPPATVVNRAGQSFTMIDGGIFANNPTMCAIVEARRLYGSTDCLIVSLGTGSEPTRVNASAANHWGDLGWALPMITIFMASSSQTVAVETDEMFPHSHHRFDISLTTSTSRGEIVNREMDDASPDNVQALIDKANQLIDSERDRIQELAKALSQPKAELAPRTKRPKTQLLFSAKEDGVPAA
jgi:patatin-like phospholipase/acyl hydrolase